MLVVKWGYVHLVLNLQHDTGWITHGSLTLDMYRDSNSVMKFVYGMVGHANGPYTQPFAGLSSEVNIEKSGSWGTRDTEVILSYLGTYQMLTFS